MTTLEVFNLSKRFRGTQRSAVSDISFELCSGEILALVGPSGCGKTTILRIVAGLERPDSGSVRLNDRVVVAESVFVPPENRGVGMVFQEHALFPHLSVSKNIAFGLRGRSREQIRERVIEMLDLVGLQPLGDRYPHALSGGERQRVALARALAPSPVLVLMDEPFSSLDADLRLEMREQVRHILKAMQATVVFVTHDQDEALYMGDRLAVLKSGKLEQIGTPEAIFHSSNTRFVAQFMGDSDFLKGTVTQQGIQTELGLVNQVLALPASTQVDIAIRADDIGFRLNGTGNSVIVERFFQGAFNLYRLRLDSGQILHGFTDHTQVLPVGARVTTYISAEHPLTIFAGEQVLTVLKSM